MITDSTVAALRGLCKWSPEHEQILCPAQALYQKQGRSRQFSSKEDRDAHIGDEIKQLERAAAVKRSSADELRSHVQQLTSQLMDLSQVWKWPYAHHPPFSPLIPVTLGRRLRLASMHAPALPMCDMTEAEKQGGRP